MDRRFLGRGSRKDFALHRRNSRLFQDRRCGSNVSTCHVHTNLCYPLVSRAFTAWMRRTHHESLIRRLTSRAFLSSLSPFLVSPSPPLRPLRHSFVVLSLLSPPANLLSFPAFCSSQCHWISLGKPRQLCVNLGSFPLLSSSELRWDSGRTRGNGTCELDRFGDSDAVSDFNEDRRTDEFRVIFTGSQKLFRSITILHVS